MNHDYRTARATQQSVTYPAVIRANNLALESRINRLIRDTALSTLPSGRYLAMNIISAASKYDITVNKKEILSIRFENFFYPEKMANGITLVRGLTLNLITGKRYRLGDLFTPGVNYQQFLNKIILQQIKEQEIPLLEEYPGIRGDEEFYLTEDSLVIVYQRYQLTPGFYGVLELTIPFPELTPVIDQESPIYKLMKSP